MTDFIFLHGAMMGGYVWGQLIAAMQERAGDTVRCLALDIPGCGSKRDLDTGTMPFDRLVDDLLADIEASGMSDAVLVGHSQGGTVLPRLVEARPGLFRKLVYIACLAPLPGQTVMEASGAENDGREVKATAVLEGLRTMLCNDMDAEQTREFLALLRSGDAWPVSSYTQADWRYDHLAAVPSTYVFCEKDNCVPPAKQEAYLANLHIDRLVRIDSGHQPMNSRPQELAAILLSEAQ